MVMYRWIYSDQKEQRRDPNAQMNVQLKFGQCATGYLQVISPMVEWGVGETQGQVKTGRYA